MLVKEIMTTNVKTIRPEDSVKSLAQRMVKDGIGDMVVVSGSGVVVGIATERDIIRDIVISCGNLEETKVQDIMTKELVTIGPDISLEEAADIMVKHKIKKLPIIDNGRLVGIVTATDLVAYENRLVDKVADLIMSSPMKNIGG
jgi:CBS domain-containing protein